jgi:hypothetical protein
MGVGINQSRETGLFGEVNNIGGFPIAPLDPRQYRHNPAVIANL